MSTSIGNGVAKFDNWNDSAGNKRKTVVGFGYAKWVSPDDGYVAISNGAYYTTPLSLTYTPKFSTSLLVITVVNQVRCITGAGAVIRLHRNGTLISPWYNNGGNIGFFYKGDTINHHMNLRGRMVTPANSTSATTFTTSVGGIWGSTEFSRGWGDHSIFVMELAQ